MANHKGRDALALSPLWLVLLDEPFNYFIVHLCILSTFLENNWSEILLEMMKPCRFSDTVIHLPIIAVIMDMTIMNINNGPIQLYQQQMLYLWNLARAVISDAR